MNTNIESRLYSISSLILYPYPLTWLICYAIHQYPAHRHALYVTSTTYPVLIRTHPLTAGDTSQGYPRYQIPNAPARLSSRD